MGIIDAIKYMFSRKKIKPTNTRKHITRDDNGRILVNGKYPTSGYKFYDQRSKSIYVVDGDGRQRTLKPVRKNFVNRSKQDKKLGNTIGYGQSDYNTFDRKKLSERINPGAGINDYITQGWKYITGDTTMPGATDQDKAFWKRYLGFNRDTTYMPYTNVRFRGDVDANGELLGKNKNKEYTGVDRQTKQSILQRIKDGDLTPSDDWQTAKESDRLRTANNNTRYTSHLGDFAYRENGNSGIYDVYDTYDFPNFLNRYRKPGYEIEVRDTIWGPNAKPNLYNPMFSTRGFK